MSKPFKCARRPEKLEAIVYTGDNDVEVFKFVDEPGFNLNSMAINDVLVKYSDVLIKHESQQSFNEKYEILSI